MSLSTLPRVLLTGLALSTAAGAVAVGAATGIASADPDPTDDVPACTADDLRADVIDPVSAGAFEGEYWLSVDNVGDRDCLVRGGYPALRANRPSGRPAGITFRHGSTRRTADLGDQGSTVLAPGGSLHSGLRIPVPADAGAPVSRVAVTLPGGVVLDDAHWLGDTAPGAVGRVTALR